MSGFEDYCGELEEIDREIRHFAAACGVDLADSVALRACLNEEHDEWADDRARVTLRGLLALRLKVEIEMLEQGLQPAELSAGTGLGASESAPADEAAA